MKRMSDHNADNNVRFSEECKLKSGKLSDLCKEDKNFNCESIRNNRNFCTAGDHQEWVRDVCPHSCAATCTQPEHKPDYKRLYKRSEEEVTNLLTDVKRLLLEAKQLLHYYKRLYERSEEEVTDVKRVLTDVKHLLANMSPPRSNVQRAADARAARDKGSIVDMKLSAYSAFIDKYLDRRRIL